MRRYRFVVLGVGFAGAGRVRGLDVLVRRALPGARRRASTSGSGSSAWRSRASSGGMTLTLLGWGLLTDRVGERTVISIGLSGAAVLLAAASTADTFLAAGGARDARRDGRSGRQRRDRPRRDVVVPGERARASRSASARPRCRSAAGSAPWSCRRSSRASASARRSSRSRWRARSPRSRRSSGCGRRRASRRSRSATSSAARSATGGSGSWPRGALCSCPCRSP